VNFRFYEMRQVQNVQFPACSGINRYSFFEMIPRVLILMGDEKLTGPVKGILQLFPLLEKKNGLFFLANCVVADVNTDEITEEFSGKGISVREIRHRSKGYLGLLRQAKSLAVDIEPTIVQTHGYKQSIVGVYLKYCSGCKWICFLHGTTALDLKDRFYNLFDSFIQKFADRVVIMTETQRGKIPGGSDKKRVRVIHNGVDWQNPVRIKEGGKEIRSTLDIQSQFLFAVIGRLSPEKGVDVFLHAFAKVVLQNPLAGAVIVGDGPERDSLRVLLGTLQLEKYVQFVGYSRQPGDYMEAVDCLVLPSRSEGIPNVVLEAMALKKPVVAAAVGGVPEIMEDAQTGLLVEKDDPDQLAAAMLKIIEDGELRRKISINGFHRIVKKFSPQRRADKVYSLYLELTEE
jgi:glycosyltransferase involved in cell wall biosynthesis